jgi:hypothetical protein
MSEREEVVKRAKRNILKSEFKKSNTEKNIDKLV